MNLIKIIKDWINSIKVSDNGPLNKKIKELEAKDLERISDLNLYDLKVKSLEEDLEEANEKIKSLLTPEPFNVNDHKDWYEGRRQQQSWEYDGKRLGKKDVKEYLKPSDKQPFVELAGDLIDKYHLTSENTAQEIVTAMYKYFSLKSSWTYAYDKDQWKSAEWWGDPTVAVLSRKDDCETKAMVMYNTVEQMFISLEKEKDFWRLTFVASMVLAEGGHGYLTWLADDGRYYVVESTYDAKGSLAKVWLKTPIDETNMYYNFWGFATKTRSWKGSNSAFMGFTL